jgi:hypothetical protein
LFNSNSCEKRAEILTKCIENGGGKNIYYVQKNAQAFLSLQNNCRGCQHNGKCSSKAALEAISELESSGYLCESDLER